MSDACELCRRAELIQIHEPHGSTRGIKISLCHHCGLVQSLARSDRALHVAAAVSTGADWANIGDAKSLRTGAAIATIRRHADLHADLQVLDVGANRGSFVRGMLQAA